MKKQPDYQSRPMDDYWEDDDDIEVEDCIDSGEYDCMDCGQCDECIRRTREFDEITTDEAKRP